MTDTANPSAESYICHVADAPSAHHHAPEPHPLAADALAGGTPTAAMTTAVLIAAESYAAESYAPSSQIPQTKQVRGRYDGAADPFIAAVEDEDEEEAPPVPEWASELPGDAPAARAAAVIVDVEDVPRRSPAPQEDRVRGYSVIQGSSMASSHVNAAAVEGEYSQASTAEKGRGVSVDGASPSLDSVTALPAAEADSHGPAGAALAVAEQRESMPPLEGADEHVMKALVSHVDHDSYGFHLREALQRTDFESLSEEYRRGSSVESAAMEECRHLFRVISKNKDAISAEDVYNLLVIFTPCGVSFREGVDFLWENCEGKSSLSFEHFIHYGPRLRARLRGYELFSQLSDPDKLLVMHHRVMPGEPIGSPNEARVRLVELADEQMDGVVRPHTRPLRLYEEFFLVEYQDMLYEHALIPADEVLQREHAADYAHDPMDGAMPQLSVPVLQHERTDWRADDNGAVESATTADGRPRVTPYDGSASASQVSPVHRDANGHARTQPQGRSVGKMGRRGPSPSKSGAATARGATGMYGPYNAAGSRSGRGADRGLAVTLQSRPRAGTRKNLGRFVEEEYWERRTLDDHLIQQLQNMYSAEQ